MTQVLNEAARIANWGQPCELPGGSWVEIDGKAYDVNPAFAEGWEAWEFIRARYEYAMPGTDTGHYSCRHILHDPTKPWSEHAWRGLAFDMNWLQNPWGGELVTDMPPGMTRAFQLIKTNDGEYVFRWGGDWDRDPDTPHSTYDAMHFSQTASRENLATGIDWSTVEGWLDMAYITKENQRFLNAMADQFKLATHPKGDPPDFISPLSEHSIREFAEGNRWFFHGAGLDLRDDDMMAEFGKDLKALIEAHAE